MKLFEIKINLVTIFFSYDRTVFVVVPVGRNVSKMLQSCLQSSPLSEKIPYVTTMWLHLRCYVECVIQFTRNMYEKKNLLTKGIIFKNRHNYSLSSID